VPFYAQADRLNDGTPRAVWSGGQEVLAAAHDVMIPGYTKATNTLTSERASPSTGLTSTHLTQASTRRPTPVPCSSAVPACYIAKLVRTVHAVCLVDCAGWITPTPQTICLIVNVANGGPTTDLLLLDFLPDYLVLLADLRILCKSASHACFLWMFCMLFLSFHPKSSHHGKVHSLKAVANLQLPLPLA
jgi:hypothetical protein